MTTAIYPGSFDPPTFGHLDIIKRAAAIFDRVVVCVMKNGGKENGLFSVKERVCLLEELTCNYQNVEIDEYEGLLAEYVKFFQKPVVVRGLRAITDFEYEFQMATVNKKLNSNVETMFLVASNEYTFLSSSVVRELGKYGTRMSCFVPQIVEDAIREKFPNSIPPLHLVASE